MNRKGVMLGKIGTTTTLPKSWIFSRSRPQNY